MEGRGDRRWIGSRVRDRLTYANVTATLALFVALGTGGAFAAGQIGTSQIKDGAVTAAKLHTGAVTTDKIKDGAVNGAKVAPDSLTGANIRESSLGQVPSASRATSATDAMNSSHLGDLPASSFLKGSDAVAGGDLTGMYGLPVIKDGAVGTTKFGTIPAAHIENSSPSSVALPPSTPTTLSWDTVEFDTDGMFSAANPTRLTAPVAGTYLVTGVAGVSASSGGAGAEGYVELRATVNGGTNYFATESFVLPANGDFEHGVTGIIHLGAGDYVEEVVEQGATAATMAPLSSLSARLGRTLTAA